MEQPVFSNTESYALETESLQGRVRAFHGDTLIAETRNAKVMYETRLPPVIYFPEQDVTDRLKPNTSLKTFCPFKGTARYFDLDLGGRSISNAAWTYAAALPESKSVRGHVGFMPQGDLHLDLGDNELRPGGHGHISAPLVDWLLREAPRLRTPEEFTKALADQLVFNGIAISRLSVMIWSLHPSIAGRNFIWNKGERELTTYAPSYEIYDHPAFVNSPLRHVSAGLGGVRQRIEDDDPEASFPIIEDLRKSGATDYVAMPLVFSDGQTNVLTLTSDHPSGFTTANLGLIFECSGLIGRIYEVFSRRETAQGLLETYVGKRTGARVLGGEIRRGDGDQIDAAIMFCDLRGSSRLVDELGQAEYIDLLNTFFETSTDAVHEHGGEVLKFIGDAVLAVFPADGEPEKARAAALTAAREIVQRLAGEKRHTDCDCSIGMAYGRVTYGNVGSRERLDFTVIGNAANVAARLGDFGKTRGHRIVATSDFPSQDCDTTDLGLADLHNVKEPVRCMAVAPE